MKQLALFAFGAALMGGWLWVTHPQPIDGDRLNDEDGMMLEGYAPDGEILFAAAGCASCHTPDETGALSGGKALVSDFGTFYAPNISTSFEHGIGNWTRRELVNAIMAGVSPSGEHYYPSLPYGSYNKMTPQDAVDIVAHMWTLPASETPSLDHAISFPFNIRRAVGVWKTLYMTDDWVIAGDLDPQLDRGRYLVEALGHCAECHTPRTALGGLDTGQWMRGATNPSGDGTIPSIHPDDLGWSAQDIAIYLDSGFTPDFDTAGGSMADVVDNTSKLSDDDRAAIAAYLIALP